MINHLLRQGEKVLLMSVIDLQPGSILAVFSFVEVDLGDSEIGMTKEGRDDVEVVADFFTEERCCVTERDRW